MGSYDPQCRRSSPRAANVPQRAAVRPPLRGALPTFGEIGTSGVFLARCLDLLGLLKAKEELILRQALGPAAEAGGRCNSLMIWVRRAFSTSRARTIAFSTSGSSGSWSAVIAMTG